MSGADAISWRGWAVLGSALALIVGAVALMFAGARSGDGDGGDS